MNTPCSSNGVAVVIASRNRTGLLIERTLPSVLAQTLPPKYLVLVDDSSLDVRTRNRELIENLNLPGCTTIYLENSRTEGASGCWNTAVDFFFSRNENPANLFVAILDDDDAWDERYLETCYAAATSQDLDFVATDFCRIEVSGATPLACDAPATLCADDFLTGNPGIQGSNMFMRLSILVLSGGFDEALKSSTDRDLCIRIADHGSIRYRRNPTCLVYHFAEQERIRLSTPGSAAKLQGLTAFWRKHGGRMTNQQRQDFKERAARLFDWYPPSAPSFSKIDRQSDSTHDRPSTAPGVVPPSKPSLHDRVVIAEKKVKELFSLDRLRLLGSGTEGVVFTDEILVYKCFDGWTFPMSRTQRDFLRSQVGRWRDVPGLYSISEVVEDGTLVILTYEYETSVPYQGGHEDAIVSLLQGCYATGIVCNNMHPKNLILSKSGAKLVDYGSDIRKFSYLGFEHMVRRAFLTCHYPAHPELRSIMRRILIDRNLSEFPEYGRFRSLLNVAIRPLSSCQELSSQIPPPLTQFPVSLYVGIITSAPSVVRPLLFDLVALKRETVVKQLVVVLLDNGAQPQDMDEVCKDARCAGLKIVLVTGKQQHIDSAAGFFGELYQERPAGRVGIAQARTMIQRYLGTLLDADCGSFGWLLDDDMRVDTRAGYYLQWLPAFRANGVDVLIGAYEGSSPNPGLNGVRVHLVDLFYNILWLRQLPPDSVLPDRSRENSALRAENPDYYYDLSRKHTAHLEMPFWLEPEYPGETVAEAISRLLEGALGILNGDPLTRPIVTDIPKNPLDAARSSVNRGGNTFILNSRALTQTPNLILSVQGREARRSDMIWAILNRNYRRMNIKSIAFPIRHLGRIEISPVFDVGKVQDEIIGSVLYAGLTDFFEEEPQHALDFSPEELRKVRLLVECHLNKRLRRLDQNFRRIQGLCDAIQRISIDGEFTDLLGYLDQWITYENFQLICTGARAATGQEIEGFLASLRAAADDYSCGSGAVHSVAKLLNQGVMHES